MLLRSYPSVLGPEAIRFLFKEDAVLDPLPRLEFTATTSPAGAVHRHWRLLEVFSRKPCYDLGQLGSFTKQNECNSPQSRVAADGWT